MSYGKIIMMIISETCEIVGATPSKPVVSIRSDSGNQVWLVWMRFGDDVIRYYDESMMMIALFCVAFLDKI